MATDSNCHMDIAHAAHAWDREDRTILRLHCPGRSADAPVHPPARLAHAATPGPGASDLHTRIGRVLTAHGVVDASGELAADLHNAVLAASSPGPGRHTR